MFFLIRYAGNQPNMALCNAAKHLSFGLVFCSDAPFEAKTYCHIFYFIFFKKEEASHSFQYFYEQHCHAACISLSTTWLQISRKVYNCLDHFLSMKTVSICSIMNLIEMTLWWFKVDVVQLLFLYYLCWFLLSLVLCYHAPENCILCVKNPFFEVTKLAEDKLIKCINNN